MSVGSIPPVSTKIVKHECSQAVKVRTRKYQALMISSRERSVWLIGCSYNGSTSVSKTVHVGSIPTQPAKIHVDIFIRMSRKRIEIIGCLKFVLWISAIRIVRFIPLRLGRSFTLVQIQHGWPKFSGSSTIGYALALGARQCGFESHLPDQNLSCWLSNHSRFISLIKRERYSHTTPSLRGRALVGWGVS